MVIKAKKFNKSNYWKVQDELSKLSKTFDDRKNTDNPMSLEEYEKKYYEISRKYKMAKSDFEYTKSDKRILGKRY